MIYLLATFLTVALWHYAGVARSKGFTALRREVGITLAAGLIAGGFVAAGARLGMRLIAMANHAPPRISWSGTSLVFAVYCGVGALCAVLYAAVFRPWLRRRGAAYGSLLIATTWYPFAHAGAQQLASSPTFWPFAIWSGALVTLMWLPYACVLERLLTRWMLDAPETATTGRAASGL